MKWIGLTGGIATGKSTVAKILRDQGLPVVDADSLARDVVRPGSEGLRRVVEVFGQSVLSTDRSLDRSALGRIVFADEKKRLQLEGILHPLIQELRATERRRLEQEGFTLAFYDVPLLFEKNLESEFDATILVYSTEAEQRARLRERDRLSDADIDKRLRSQLSIDQKMKRASYVVFNHGSVSDLKRNVQSVLAELG